MSKLEHLKPGAIFAGDFRVMRLLGEGGMGVVYVAEQLSTGKERALKVMLPELVADPSLRARFVAEARVGARIRSDHVVEVIGAGVDGASGMPWLAMELLEGEDLATHMERGPLSRGDVRVIAEQLRHGLGEAHRAGIVHRDLKPENIYLAAPRRPGQALVVKVLDFGIARVTAEARTTSSATSVVLGTPLWMAPEQALPGTKVTPAADVWAVGLIVYNMLTGRSFWRTCYSETPSVMMLMNEAFMLPMATPSERAAEDGCAHLLPDGFDAWFERCAARPPEDRFPDADEALGALDALLAGPGADAGSDERAGRAAASGADERGGRMDGRPAPAGAAAPALAARDAFVRTVASAGAPEVHITGAASAGGPEGAPGSPAGDATAASAIEAATAAAAASVMSALQAASATAGGGARRTVSATSTVSVTEAGASDPGGAAPPSAQKAGTAGRSRAGMLISVMVSVTVAFGAVGLAVRSFFVSSGMTADTPTLATARPHAGGTVVEVNPTVPEELSADPRTAETPALARTSPSASASASSSAAPVIAGAASAARPQATARPAKPDQGMDHTKQITDCGPADPLCAPHVNADR